MVLFDVLKSSDLGAQQSVGLMSKASFHWHAPIASANFPLHPFGYYLDFK